MSSPARSLTLVRTAVLVGVLLLAAAAGAAQKFDGQRDPSPYSGFELASIRSNPKGGPDQSIRRQPGGRFSAVNLPMRDLIKIAFDVTRFERMDGPSSLLDRRYDIEAILSGRPEKPTD